MTPSFARDFERCRVLARSVRRHAASGIDHYIVVDRRDERLFSCLRSPRTHLVVKQDILPRWLWQIPFAPKWWLNLKGPPARGWIIQQIVKLSVDAVTGADVCIFIDSDIFLVKRFDPRAAEREGRVPMFREILPAENRENERWHAAAARLLGLEAEPGGRTSYVGPLVTWVRDNVCELHEHMERTTGSDWREGLCRLVTMSEYVLYGMFCDHVLRERSGHYPDNRISTLNSWGTDPLDEGALRALHGRLRPEHAAVHISSRSNTDVAAICRAFDAGEGV